MTTKHYRNIDVPHIKPPERQSMIHSFDHKKLLAHVQTQNWDAVWDDLYKILNAHTSGSGNENHSLHLASNLRKPETKKQTEALCTLVSQIFITCLTNNDIPFSDKDFYRLIFLHETLHIFFHIANISDTDSYVETIFRSEKNLSDLKQKKLLMLLRLDSDLPIANILEKTSPPYRGAAVIGYFRYGNCYKMVSHDNKISLLSFRKDIRSIPVDIETLKYMTTPYFKCSYIDHSRKHDIKEDINLYVQSFIEKYKNNIPKAVPRDNSSQREKPVLVVFAEVMYPSHAMFRSWVARIGTFRKKFHVVFIGIEMMNFNPAKHGMCDEYFSMSLLELHLLFHKINEINPDMIFFPSVGMNMASILLSNYRLAPVQAMTLGHPATTHSPFMDCIIGRKDFYSPLSFETDAYIVENSTVHHSPPDALTKEMLPVAKDNAPKDNLHIMMCGMVLKLSAPFLQAVRTMIEELSVPTKTTIITSTKGLDRLVFEDFVKTQFKNCQVVTYPGYVPYFELLKTADIVLDPFPFGHSHTMIDALLAGKPIVSLRGEEAHGRVEWGLLKDLGLAEQFSTDSVDDYKRKFKELSQKILDGKTNFFDPADIYYRVFEKEYTFDYAGLLWWIYQNREKIKTQKGQIIYPD